MNVDGPLQHNSPVADGGVHELMAREGTARLTDETFQQAEFRRRQVQLAALHVSPMPHPVDANAEMFADIDPVRRKRLSGVGSP